MISAARSLMPRRCAWPGSARPTSSATGRTAHHSFTYCNAVHQALKRLARRAEASYVEAVRGVFHGAMTVYLDRYLNIPPARLPGEGRRPAR